ncbi:hypothetical protein FRC18_005900 [Serendipita sp. 400]|nr:hypothetical protein FRC18_005900 [Serendipita sp. 400]
MAHYTTSLVLHRLYSSLHTISGEINPRVDSNGRLYNPLIRVPMSGVVLNSTDKKNLPPIYIQNRCVSDTGHNFKVTHPQVSKTNLAREASHQLPTDRSRS